MGSAARGLQHPLQLNRRYQRPRLSQGRATTIVDSVGVPKSTAAFEQRHQRSAALALWCQRSAAPASSAFDLIFSGTREHVLTSRDNDTSALQLQLPQRPCTSTAALSVTATSVKPSFSERDVQPHQLRQRRTGAPAPLHSSSAAMLLFSSTQHQRRDAAICPPSTVAAFLISGKAMLTAAKSLGMEPQLQR